MGTSSVTRKRNRSWPEALKQEIVAAALAPGSSVSKAARRYDVNANQVFGWCKRLRAEVPAAPELRLMPMTVTPDPPPAAQPDERIEIELLNGYRLRVTVGVTSAVLSRVLDVLERR
jgi:transposase